MKILVTGSNGLLGQKLIQLLSKKDNVELLATSKGENRFKNKEGYQYQSLDITNRTEVIKEQYIQGESVQFNLYQ